MNDEQVLKSRLKEIEEIFARGNIDIDTAVPLMIEKDRIDRALFHLAGK